MTRQILLILLLISSLNSASFDCKKASTKIEKTICSDSDLSNLDSKLGDTYRELKVKIAQNQLSKENAKKLRSFFIKTQRKWLRNRNRWCSKQHSDELKACLDEHYTQRIKKLESFTTDGSFIYANYANVLFNYNHIPYIQNSFKELLDREAYAEFLDEYSKWEESYGVCVDKYGVLQEECVVGVAKRKTAYYERLLESYRDSKYLVEDGNVTQIKRVKKSFLKSYDEEQSEICYSYRYYPQSEYKKLFHKDINRTNIIPLMAFEESNSSKKLQSCKADEYRFRVEKSDKIIFISKHLVVFARDEFSYYGGAHGNYESIYYAFDRDSAELIAKQEMEVDEGDSYESSMKKTLTKEKYEYYFSDKNSVELKAIYKSEK